MKKIWIILRKELTDSMRDRRSWATGLFWALFGPLIMGAILILLGSTFREDAEKAVNLPVQSPEHAPNLVGFLEQNNVIIVPAPADPETAVQNGEADMVLIIPEEYGDQFLAGKTAALQLFFDSSRQSAMVDVTRIQGLLEGYSDYQGNLRLIARGISPTVIRPVTVEKIDLATPQSRALLFISMLPYFIIFAIFNGASPVVIDTTAGERERNSLEPLLINPVPRRNFVLGKMIASWPFSTAGLAISLAGFGLVFNLLPIEQYLGFRLGLDVVTLVFVFLICLPIVVLASAIQMVIASFAHSTKEAGTYLPFVALIPSLPGIFIAFVPVKPALWMMLIPTFGQQLLINQFMRMEPTIISNVVISTLVTILTAACITFIAFKLYDREQMVITKG